MTGTLQVSCARFLLRDTCKGTRLSTYNTRQAILTRGRLRMMSSETRPAREKHRTDLPQNVPTSVPSDARMQCHCAMDHTAHSFMYTVAWSCGGILRSHHSVMRITACTWHLYRAMVLSDPQLSLKQNMEQDTESPCSCHRVPCHLAVTAHHSLPERMPWRIVTKSPRIVGKW